MAEERARGIAGPEAFVRFHESLAGMARAGIPLSRAVGELARGLKRGRFREAIRSVESSLASGRPLSEAVEARPADFPAAYRALVRAGEAAGNLSSVLAAIAGAAAGALRLRRALASALAYPAIVLLSGGGIVAFVLFYLKPRYERIFRDAGLALSDAYAGTGWLALLPAAMGLAAAAAFLLWWWGRRTPAGERVLLRIPFAGRALRLAFLARLFRTLSILARSRASLADVLPAALESSGSLLLAAGAEAVRARAAEGATLGEALSPSDVVPARTAARLAIAERQGRLSEALDESAAFLDEAALAAADSVRIAFAPAAILAVGIALGAAYVSMALPYIRLIERISG